MCQLLQSGLDCSSTPVRHAETDVICIDVDALVGLVQAQVVGEVRVINRVGPRRPPCGIPKEIGRKG